MVLVAHLADTHLGHRPGGVRDIRPDRRFRALEDDFYRAWGLIVDDVIDRGAEYVIHAGDLFDTPWSRNPYPPPEVARNAVATGLEKLEKDGIPVILVGGNHGYYLGYEVSTLDHFEISFDNVHVFSYWDFRDAFQANVALKHDFGDFVFHAFPYVDRSFIENLGLIEEFRQWMRLSEPEYGRLNIASCHGSSIDGTLDPHILNAGFDYVALGHDHSRGRINDRAWQSGSTERWSFKEAEQRKGYLLVDLGKESLPRVKEIEVPPRRPMIDERIDITPETRSMDIRDQIWDIFESNNLVEPFDYETAGRVKVKVAGSSSRETTTRLYRELEAIKSEALHSDELNIVQFRFERETPDKVVFRAGPTYADIQYLIENPREELLSFLREKGVEEGYDMSLMGLLFEEAIRKSEEQI